MFHYARMKINQRYEGDMIFSLCWFSAKAKARGVGEEDVILDFLYLAKSLSWAGDRSSTLPRVFLQGRWGKMTHHQEHGESAIVRHWHQAISRREIVVGYVVIQIPLIVLVMVLWGDVKR